VLVDIASEQGLSERNEAQQNAVEEASASVLSGAKRSRRALAAVTNTQEGDYQKTGGLRIRKSHVSQSRIQSNAFRVINLVQQGKMAFRQIDSRNRAFFGVWSQPEVQRCGYFAEYIRRPSPTLGFLPYPGPPHPMLSPQISRIEPFRSDPWNLW